MTRTRPSIRLKGRSVVGIALVCSMAGLAASRASAGSGRDQSTRELADELIARLDSDASFSYTTPADHGRPIEVKRDEIVQVLAGLEHIDATIAPNGIVSTAVGDPSQSQPHAPPPPGDRNVPAGLPPLPGPDDEVYLDGPGLPGGLMPMFYRVTPTSIYSANAQGYLAYTKTDGTRTYCSAYIYGTHIVATAAHCVRKNDIYFSDFTFYRGRDGGSWLQVCDDATAIYAATYTGHGTDFGAVKFNCTFPGTYGSGILPVIAHNCGGGASYPMWNDGYPGGYGAQLWEDYGYVTDAYCDTYTYSHYLYGIGGMSGGPLISADSGYCGGYAQCDVGHHVSHTGDPWVSSIAKKWKVSDIAILVAWRGY